MERMIGALTLARFDLTQRSTQRLTCESACSTRAYERKPDHDLLAEMGDDGMMIIYRETASLLGNIRGDETERAAREQLCKLFPDMLGSELVIYEASNTPPKTKWDTPARSFYDLAPDRGTCGSVRRRREMWGNPTKLPHSPLFGGGTF